jgi:hypothetical protein
MHPCDIADKDLICFWFNSANSPNIFPREYWFINESSSEYVTEREGDRCLKDFYVLRFLKSKLKIFLFSMSLRSLKWTIPSNIK